MTMGMRQRSIFDVFTFTWYRTYQFSHKIHAILVEHIVNLFQHETTEGHMPRKIGLNVLASWGAVKDPTVAIRLATDAGLDGVQLLPLRPWSNRAVVNIDPSFVIGFENAWNDGRFSETLRRLITRWDVPALGDWYLFGYGAVAQRVRHFRKLFPNALEIDTNAPRALVETQPKTRAWETAPEVVLDLHHIQELARDLGQDVFELVSRLLPRTRLVHLQFRDRTVLDAFRKRREPVIRTLLKVALSEIGTDVPIIIEVAPGLKVQAPELSEIAGIIEAIDQQNGR
jgi:hypothetical protein